MQRLRGKLAFIAGGAAGIGRGVLPAMCGQRSGSVFNMSPFAELKDSPNPVPYIASKHAIAGLTMAVAIEAAGCAA